MKAEVGGIVECCGLGIQTHSMLYLDILSIDVIQ
jgi:hypothetical protein